MKIALISCAVLIAIAVSGLGYVQYIRNAVYGLAYDETEKRPPSHNIQSEWHELSWSGKHPLRVIALAQVMADSMDPYRAAAHMTSSFYSQVKYLVKSGDVLRAVAFYLESRKWSVLTLERQKFAKEAINPIDLEVLGAPDFMIAKLPYVGRLIGMFGFKRDALKFLNAANEELEKILKEPSIRRPDPISAAMIWSKLYALTGNEFYKNRVRIAELTGREDKGQLTRIMKHLGFKSLDQLYEFCNI